MLRQFSPYEQNQLRKYGIPLLEAEQYGGIPLEYITNHAEFYGRDFLVNHSVLIPRIETEELISIALDHCSLSIADIGTGSGILGITLCLELKKRGRTPKVYLSDISSDALMVARKNISLLSKSSEKDLILLTSNLLENYPKNIKFDLIVANLPYIPSDRIWKLPSSVRDFEPRIALDGGQDGLALIKKCILELPNRLKPHGVGIFEIDETHKSTDFSKVKNLSFEIKKDQFGKNRFLVVHALQASAI